MSSGTGDGKLGSMRDLPGQTKPFGVGDVTVRTVGDEYGQALSTDQHENKPRLISIDDQRVLVLTAAKGTPSAVTRATQTTIDLVLDAIGSTIPLIVVPATMSLESLKQSDMARYGWVKQADGHLGETLDVNAIATEHADELAAAGWIKPGDTDSLAAALDNNPGLLDDAGYTSTAELLDDWVRRDEVAMYTHEFEEDAE